MIRYAITSRALFPGTNDRERLAALVEQAARWAADDVDFIQLRENDLPTPVLAELAHNIMKRVSGTSTRLLINSRLDIAIAAAAHGVHLTAAAGELTPDQVRRAYDLANRPGPFITSSCHTLAEVMRARAGQADAILFAPVFEKPLPGGEAVPGQGLDCLHEACIAAAPLPVYALGGVTLENAPACLRAGAAGFAGIRLFLC